MTEVLFEVHFWAIALEMPWIFIPACIFIVYIIGAALPFTSWKLSGVKKAWKGCLVAQMILIAFTHAGAFWAEIIPYCTGYYYVVEGDVENYTGPTNKLNRYESFWVGDVFFEYYQASVTFGYHDTTYNGDTLYNKGVITPELKNIRVTYVYRSSDDKNVIMRIEKLP